MLPIGILYLIRRVDGFVFFFEAETATPRFFVLVFYICGCYVVLIFISVSVIEQQNRDDGCAHSIIKVILVAFI